MIGFLVVGALIVLLMLALLFHPFYWKRAGTNVSRRQLNAEIYKDQLIRLERDRDEKMIGQDDYEQARSELQRRLIDDDSVADSAVTLKPPKMTLVGIGVVLPIMAVVLYLGLGNPATLDPKGPQHKVDANELNGMLEGLAKKLANEPDNLQGWAMLARSYKAVGRNAEAEQAFGRAGTLLDSDAQMLADYADVIATNAGGNLAGRPTELIEKALKIDPNNGMSLWLAGTAAYQRSDFDKAIATWERLVQQLEPGSEDEKMLQNAIGEAYAKSGKQAPMVASGSGTAPNPHTKGPPANAIPNASVSGEVELDPALKAKSLPTDIVMVIARLPGTRMPMAVLRAPASQLPLKFTLDDSLAMNPASLISATAQVEVEVRISKTGMAMPEPGDLLSAAQIVKVGAKGLKLRVDRVRP
jgi:cytochrome c-type biogenesis protein CcmH